jgi:hypothetical protein
LIHDPTPGGSDEELVELQMLSFASQTPELPEVPEAEQGARDTVGCVFLIVTVNPVAMG